MFDNSAKPDKKNHFGTFISDFKLPFIFSQAVLLSLQA